MKPGFGIRDSGFVKARRRDPRVGVSPIASAGSMFAASLPSPLTGEGSGERVRLSQGPSPYPQPLVRRGRGAMEASRT